MKNQSGNLGFVVLVFILFLGMCIGLIVNAINYKYTVKDNYQLQMNEACSKCCSYFYHEKGR